MRFEKSCGAVIFRKENDEWNVLLIRHTRGRHISYPKGHMEAGESETETAEREVFEETGLRITVEKHFRAENRYIIRGDINKLVVVFLAFTKQAKITPQPEEIAEARWVPVSEAMTTLTYERDRKILSDALAYTKEKNIP